MNFLGYDFKDLAQKATKTLAAGFLGVMVGSVIQYLLNFGGYPIILTYWLGALCGFFVNFYCQVRIKNIAVKKAQ